MDLIFDLLAFVVRALLNRPDQKKTAASRGQPTSQPPLPGRQAQAPALAPRTPTVQQDPLDDGERLRSVLTLFGLIVLVIMAAVWFLYVHGWL